MLKNISDVIYNINNNELDDFLTNTESLLNVNSSIKEINVDYNWLDVLENTLPNLDKILRNPRKFLVQEEEVKIIEKVKGINHDSIKHLAGHSENIQDMDDDGNVMPKKLLNIQKEDTTDLYENRFIYTLVKRLSDFMRKQLDNLDLVSVKEINKDVEYKASTNIGKRKVNIEVKLNDFNEIEINKNGKNYKERILACYDIVHGFMNTEMIKTLIGCTLVKDPIRKTNMILRDNDFKKCYLLWESLNDFQFRDPKVVNYENIRGYKKDIKNDFNLAYFINTNAIDENSKNIMESLSLENKLKKIINEYIYEENQNIDNFTETVDDLYNKAIKDKEMREKEITNIYNNFIELYYNNIKNMEKLFE